MPQRRLIFWVALAMLAFAANSLLCRLALKHTGIDPASFIAVRLLSGAAMLWTVVLWRRRRAGSNGANPPPSDWRTATALFVYAAGFSFAYVSLPAGTGALLLFGAVQATMVGGGLRQGERLRPLQWAGLALALAGLAALVWRGLAAPSISGAMLMLLAGVAWGIYSLRGRRQPAGAKPDPAEVSAGHFSRAASLAVLLGAVMWPRLSVDGAGLVYAVASGAVASALGYLVWYRVLPALKSTHAATVQLSVPVLAALGGVVLLGEAITAPMVLASAAILGGIALVVRARA